MEHGRFTFVDLFAGIGGFHAALRAFGGDCAYAVEIDSAAAAVYERNWGRNPLGDISEDATDSVMKVPAHDVLTAGFPCQPFSKSGAQRGMDEARGTLYWHILKIIERRKPTVVLLENVRNLAGPRHAHEWQVIIETLRDQGYRVSDTPAIFSPHLLPPHRGGRPQVRERVFITATHNPTGIDDGLPVTPVARPDDVVDGWNARDKWHLEDLLDDSHNVPGCQLSRSERLWIDAWDEFVVALRRRTEGRWLPGFPLWADSWTDFDDVVREFGGVPDYRALMQRDPSLPQWKASHLAKNYAFYRLHRDYIDEWASRFGVYTDAFPPSRRKLEWQARDAPRLWDTVMHFRPSGIRAKAPTYLPALVAITQTSVIGPRERRLSPRETARLQGLPDSFDFGDQSAAATYRQMGNGVNVGVVWHILREHAKRDEDILKRTEAGWRIWAAVMGAPPSPDGLLSEHTPASFDGIAKAPRRRQDVRMGRFGTPFQPAQDKLEAVNRISAITSSGPEVLGPGSKERKSVLVNLAQGLGLGIDPDLSKPELAGAIATALGTTWTQACWSSGQTITLTGLNTILAAAEASKSRSAPTPASAEEEGGRILQSLAATMPRRWDGRECVQQMLDAEDSQWAQDEWKGFYLEFLAGACAALGGERNACDMGVRPSTTCGVGHGTSRRTRMATLWRP